MHSRRGVLPLRQWRAHGVLGAFFISWVGGKESCRVGFRLLERRGNTGFNSGLHTPACEERREGRPGKGGKY